MRTSEIFVLGMTMGAVLTWLFGKDVESYVGERARGARTRAAEGIRAVDEKTGRVLDRGGQSLRRAEGFLQDTKEHVSETLRAGENAIRPSGTTREA